MIAPAAAAVGSFRARKPFVARTMLGSDYQPTANALWNSMGVNIGLREVTNTGGGTTADQIARIQNLGFKHVRGASYFVKPDGNGSAIQSTNANPVTSLGRTNDPNQQSWTQMQAIVDAGLVSVQAIMNPIWSYLPTNVGGTGDKPEEFFQGWFQHVVRVAREQGWLNAITGWEWPNEWNSSFAGGDGTGQGHTVANKWGRMAAYFLRRDRDAWDKPIVGPSHIGGESSFGDSSFAIDAGNLHPYRGNKSANHIALNIEIDAENNISPGLPKWVTEVGDSSLDSPATDSGTDFTQVLVLPHDKRAILALRQFLFNWWTNTPQAAGVTHAQIPRTYYYELRNQFNDNDFNGAQALGFYNHANVINPVGTAVKNLIALLGTKADPATVNVPAYSVTGFTDRPFAVSGATSFGNPWGSDNDNDIHYDFAVKRQDGTYLIFLWRSYLPYIWDIVNTTPFARNGRTTAPAAVNCTVTVPNMIDCTQANPRTASTFSGGLTLFNGGTPNARVVVPLGIEVVCLRATV